MKTFLIWLYIALLVSVASAEVPQEGLKAEMQKRWDDAVNIYTEILKENPKRGDLYLRISDIHSSKKRYAQAADALNQAIKIESKAVYYKKLSEVYAVLDRPEEAMSTLKEALKLEPKNENYLIAHAKLANWDKKHLEAVSSLKKLLQNNPQHKEARLLLARSYEWSGLFEEASAYYSEHLRKNPDDLQTRLDLADIQEFFGNIHSANRTLEDGYKRVYPEKTESKQSANPLSVEVPILLYHCIDDSPQNTYWISTQEFDSQMNFLTENSYESISMRELYDYNHNSGVLPSKPVVITFDDGCQNLYSNAYPILKKHGLIAEIYLIVDSVVDTPSERQNSASGKEANKLGETGETSKTAYLTWPEIKEMSDDGIVFGSHSKSHPPMSELDDVNTTFELLYSKLAIVANTGADVTSFAYPFGDASAKGEIHQLLQKYGFVTAVAAGGGMANTNDIEFYNIPRIDIYGPKHSLDPKSKGVSVIADTTRPSDLFMAKLNPTQAQKQFELCNRYTSLKELDKALVAISRAVELDPTNIRYLNTKVSVAGAAGKADITLETALMAYNLDPDNDNTLLELARSSVWANKLDAAAIYFEIYHERHLDKKEVYIEYANVESWRGGYASAMEILERYRERFGEDDPYLEVKAGILTWGGHPTKAFEILDKKLQEDPNSYNTSFMNTVALYRDRQMVESIDSLEKTEAISPDSKDNAFLRKFITTDFRPSVRFGGEYYTDSDNVSILSGEVQGKYYLSPLTSIRAIYGIGYVSLGGEHPLAYEQDDGSNKATQSSLRVGATHRLSSKLMANISAGAAKAETHSDPVYGAGLSYFPMDALKIDLNYDRHYLVITPKTVGRGTVTDSTNLDIYWAPSYSVYLNFSTGFETYEDDYNKNTRWNVELSPKLAVLRKQHWNFDVGVSVSAYGYDRESSSYDLGYYAPKLYQSNYLIGLTNWKINDDDGVSLVVNAGMFKDNNMNQYIFGGGVYLEGVFGLYKDWMLKFNLGEDYSARYYDNEYTATSASIYITKRF